MGRHRIITPASLEETIELGTSYGKNLPPNSILALKGPLGAGKTSFVQGLALGLGIQDLVQSPTFTYLTLYEGRLPLYHFDLYRMRTESDFFSMGFEEYFCAKGIVAIEWPERLGSNLPLQALVIEFSYAPEGSGRVLTFF
ncbi:MAG: tRNA (adenosine(37)-N6)-threonylcarbamoyltransferase complex ATPase subunit type 1 TsaE [Chlamydiia bacterium]|nr:tRNA (adenosine(37)-N6)-threonylcarbamoyltransferase complex ATPase subunit type 1 TsaE [Chlamydiia bacterium]